MEHERRSYHDDNGWSGLNGSEVRTWWIPNWKVKVDRPTIAPTAIHSTPWTIHKQRAKQSDNIEVEYI